MNHRLRTLITILVCLISAYGIPLYFYIYPKVLVSIQQNESLTSLPVTAETDEGPFDETLTVSSGDTLASLLQRLKISPQQVHEVITELSKFFTPHDLKIGQEIYVLYRPQPDNPENYQIDYLSLRPSIDYEVEVARLENGMFSAKKIEKQLAHMNQTIEGTISLSLYADGLKAGASPKMLSDMIKAFSYDVDFQRDIHEGDQFTLIYDNYKDQEMNLERPGELLYAKLVLADQTYEVYRFQPPGGTPEFYTAKGEAVRKALLRTPIDGARLSSGFGKRKHPIKGYTKMHKGLDFAAPQGTPIMAAGDGVVERASRFSGYGNYVLIRHTGSTKTAYAHLSRYGKGVKAGSRVKQGQTIGYVGSTGHSTGPHLHFELLQNGKHVNPQKVTQLPTTKLAGKILKAFQEAKNNINIIYLSYKKENLAKNL